jgi:hypothetical protein
MLGTAVSRSPYLRRTDNAIKNRWNSSIRRRLETGKLTERSPEGDFQSPTGKRLCTCTAPLMLDGCRSSL